MGLDRETEEDISEVKEEIYKRTSIIYTRSRQKMRMEVNAYVLDYATDGILSMKCEDGKLRPVVYLSKSLNKIERNYEIYDKEMLAVIRGLENWGHLLESAKFKFKV